MLFQTKLWHDFYMHITQNCFFPAEDAQKIKKLNCTYHETKFLYRHLLATASFFRVRSASQISKLKYLKVWENSDIF
jgi:hypothetical protein